jgi:Glutaredoxin-like domain (DUF836)
MKFTLYSRSYCHLCEDMLHALQAFGVAPPYSIDVIDIDADPELLARYDELVPVLLGQKNEADSPVQLCHYHLDPAALNAFFSAGV